MLRLTAGQIAALLELTNPTPPGKGSDDPREVSFENRSLYVAEADSHVFSDIAHTNLLFVSTQPEGHAGSAGNEKWLIDARGGKVQL